MQVKERKMHKRTIGAAKNKIETYGRSLKEKQSKKHKLLLQHQQQTNVKEIINERGS